jgi:serine/threonine-protein kinase
VAIHPGDILAGYRVTRLLGRGGMGEVWAAVGEVGQAAGRSEVAIKVLLARAAMKPDLVRRFEREAKITSAINSPFVCQLLEVTRAEDGAHLLVFEHLAGESLADRLKREQYLPFSEVGPIIEDVLQGLVAAHEAGVVHRDLKPGNIFLEQARDDDGAYAPPSGGFGFGSAPPPPRRERAKILDFGISKLTRREKEEPTLTAFDATLGSFAYMAPEQVRGAARADERADIYAVGAVAFRSLSGRLPFEGSTAAVLVAMKLDRQAPSLAEATGEQWPAGIERFLERALDRRREQRFATAAEALTAWRSIQPARSSMGSPPVYDPATGETAPPAAHPAVPAEAAPAGEPHTLPLRLHRAPAPPIAGAPSTAGPRAASGPGAPRPPAVGSPPLAGLAAPRPGLTPQGQPLAPVRTKTPIPMPTKPMVTAMRAATPPAPPDPVARPVEPPAVRQLARHGTLTMDELPEGALALLGPAPEPRATLPSVPLSLAGVLPGAPGPRPPMQSYQIIEDNPTEVDGPPDMTFDGSYNPLPAPPDPGSPPGPRADGKRGKTGRQ